MCWRCGVSAALLLLFSTLFIPSSCALKVKLPFTKPHGLIFLTLLPLSLKSFSPIPPGSQQTGAPSPGTSHGHRGTALRCFWGVGSLIKLRGQSPKGRSIYCSTVPTWLITRRVKRRHMRSCVLYRSATLPVFSYNLWRQRTFFKHDQGVRIGQMPILIRTVRIQLKKQHTNTGHNCGKSIHLYGEHEWSHKFTSIVQYNTSSSLRSETS